MTTRHTIIAVTVHPDGSQTSHMWTGLPAHILDGIAQLLGDPTHLTLLPADAVKRLAPTVAGASVVYTPGRQR